MVPKSIENHEKSIPNRPKWYPGAYPKRSRQKVDFKTLPGGARKGAYNGPSAPLGRFWAPFGAPLGAKGLSKSAVLASGRT